MLPNAGCIDAGARRRTDGVPGWSECSPRYSTNSSSLRRASRTYCETSTTILLQLRGPYSVDGFSERPQRLQRSTLPPTPLPHFDAFGFGLPSPSTVSLLMASALPRHPFNLVGNESSLAMRPAKHANSREFGAKFSLRPIKNRAPYEARLRVFVLNCRTA